MDPQQALIDLIGRDPDFVAKLKLVRGLGLDGGCIGGGAIRNLVWDALNGTQSTHPSSDVDVLFFDEHDTSPARDTAIEERLSTVDPTTRWEVTNQAGVHHWFEDLFDHSVSALRSIEEAVASWPEFATCVALSIDEDDRIRVIAPHGLEDLLSMTIRRNPIRVSVAAYRLRVETKRDAERWPNVRIIDEPLDAAASR